MKKLIKAVTILLTFVMLVTAAPVIFATEVEIKLDEINTAYIADGKDGIFVTFTPEESGYYVIISDNGGNNDEIDPYVVIKDSDGLSIATDNDDENSYNFDCVFEAEKNEKYYINLCSYYSDVEYDFVISKYIDFIHQPTLTEPYVEVSWGVHAEYQWYTLEVGEEITDKNAAAVNDYDGSSSSYDPEKGWCGNFWSRTRASFFGVELDEGEIIIVDFDTTVHYEVGIWDNIVARDGVSVESGVGNGKAAFIAPWDGFFNMFAHGVDLDTRARAYFAEAVVIDGETQATLQNHEIGKHYFCKVTFENGEVLTSDFFNDYYLITHQPTEDERYVELNYDEGATYQWYSVELGEEISDVNDDGTKWKGFYYDRLEAGETITFVLDRDASYLDIWIESGTLFFINYPKGKTFYTFTPDFKSVYNIYLGGDQQAKIRVFSGGYELNKIDGATTDTLTSKAGGFYVCEVTYKDGTTEMTDCFEIIHTHTDEDGDGICDGCDETLKELCDKCGKEAHTSFFAKIICDIKAFFAGVVDFFVNLFSFDF